MFTLHFSMYLFRCRMQLSRTNSPIGRNATFFSLHYETCIDNLFDTNLAVTNSVLHFLNLSYLQIHLLELTLYAAIRIRDGIFAQSNAYHSYWALSPNFSFVRWTSYNVRCLLIEGLDVRSVGCCCCLQVGHTAGWAAPGMPLMR